MAQPGSNPLKKEAQVAGQQPHSVPAVIEQQDTQAQGAEGASNKYTKDEVNYRSAGKSPTRCVYCKFYQPGYGTNSCSQVEGPIRPGDVCDLYQPVNQAQSNPSKGASITDLVGPKGV
jgi:hypothetical protein